MGELKRGWTRVKFGDVVRQVKDKIDPATAGIDRVVRGEHMDTDDLRVRRWEEVGDDYLGPAFHMRFRPGQVLYGSRRTYLRKVAQADFEGITANTTFVVETKDPGVLLPGLLPFIMTAEPFHDHSIKQSKGSVNPYVNFSDLAWYEFELPPLEQQRRIVGLLRKFEAAQCASAELVEAQALARDALLKETVRDHANAFGTRDAKSLLRRLTVGIVVKPAAWYTDEAGGVPALRSLNVLAGKIVEDDLVFISYEGHRKHSKSALSPGDVVVVRSGRPGDAAVIPEGRSDLNAIDLIVSTPADGLRPHYLAAVLNSTFGRIQLAAGTAGTAQLHFNVKLFKTLQVPLAPVEEQDRLCGCLAEVERGVERGRDRHAQLAEAKKAAMRRVL